MKTRRHDPVLQDQFVRAGITGNDSMKANHKLSVPKSHSLVGLPLFERDWRETRPRHPATTAGQHLVRKFRVSPSIADAIADFAGLGPREAMR
jgi:hypothetical protein